MAFSRAKQGRVPKGLPAKRQKSLMPGKWLKKAGGKQLASAGQPPAIS
jgi:hypothetical protein